MDGSITIDSIKHDRSGKDDKKKRMKKIKPVAACNSRTGVISTRGVAFALDNGWGDVVLGYAKAMSEKILPEQWRIILGEALEFETLSRRPSSICDQDQDGDDSPDDAVNEVVDMRACLGDSDDDDDDDNDYPDANEDKNRMMSPEY